jgi:hypothetical protein
MYMETQKPNINKDIQDFFKKQRKYVSNDGLIIFYTLKDKKLYDRCCPYERLGVQKGCVDKYDE